MTHSYTYAEARELMYETIHTYVEANWPASYPNPPVWHFDDLEDENLLNILRPTLAVYVRHFASDKTTIGGATRELFTRKGLVIVKVWTTKDTGLKTGDEVAYIVKSALEGKRAIAPGEGILFRRVRVTEQGIINNRVQHTVVADFEYDEAVERA